MARTRQNWNSQELELLAKFFSNTWTLLTLYQRINAINPTRSHESVAREIRRWKKLGWEKIKEAALRKLRVGYLDIEATNLNADFGFILSWFIKYDRQNKYEFGVVKKEELFNYKFDRRVVEELLKAFDNFDVLWTHWGVDRRFDIPYIRSRAYKHNLQDMLPRYMEKFILDTWPIARNKLKLHSNRLDSIAQALNIRNVKKTSLDSEKWTMAMFGHPKSLEYILDHNKKDVILLERVVHKLSPISRPIYRSM